ncbi:MAG: glycine cleavage system protein GcvH [Porticoccaceae bacterium]|nr:glycine cleavage system protein GcvH [Porticoccaceae bacterium]
MSEAVYTEDHEWLLIEGDVVTIGVTEFAQEQLGDVVFVELPELGAELGAGDEAAVVESVKAAGEINSPLDGTVSAINEALVESPDLLNIAPQSDGWMFKLSPTDELDASAFMSGDEYQQFLANNN